ncbi:hypothetical protein NLJ89_g6584 [Agrocybe chaxingu]|uniref:Uncharacterized protein n=1 Tax=Agrocybe chaxingu TaxID=84603 RepID=A0A9W8MSJ9_9AGAR|nr:hypothetical protein NLJ89_g6584 [Agrocybe chaxingu]
MANGGANTNTPAPAPTHPLFIAQYAIVGHPRRTEHWSIIALLSAKKARIFELTGNYDTFAYVNYETIPTADPRQHDARGGFLLCPISDEKLEWFANALKAIEVVRGTPDYDCQTWVMQAVRLLQDGGLVSRAVTEREIREELEVEKERWEVADDILPERLITEKS